METCRVLQLICIAASVLFLPPSLLAETKPSREAVRAVSQAYEELPPLLEISWREAAEYPFGVQDSAVAMCSDRLVSVAGFSRHPKNAVAAYPDLFNGELNGFTAASFIFELSSSNARWTRIANAPGPPRQAAVAAAVGSDVYVIGGFNYTDPHTYTDTCRLTFSHGEWKWESLACRLPWPICEAGVAVVDEKIYVVGGADYRPTAEVPDGMFVSETARTGDPIGRGLLMLDTQNLRAGWRRLADIPGTPRCFTTCAAVGGRVYTLGGLHYAANAFHNVVDSWAYDPQTAEWIRRPDAPHGGNRRAVPYDDRYVVMVGGHRYRTTWTVDGIAKLAYSPAEESLKEMNDHIEPTVLVFDTESNRFGTADSLLEKTSWPMVAIAGNKIYCLGGEGGNRLWHPATFQIGEISKLNKPKMQGAPTRN
jgi:hypothetical protein